MICHVTVVTYLLLSKKEKKIKLRKINKNKNKIQKFKYIITLFSTYSLFATLLLYSKL